MARKGIMEGLPKNLHNLEETCPICLLSNATKIPKGKTIDVLNCFPRFMLKMNFSFFVVEIIREFILTFLAICYDT